MSHFPELQNNLTKGVVATFTIGGWLAVIGNSLVIWTIMTSKDRKVRIPTNYFICVQAITDVMLGLVVGIIGLMTTSYNRFPGNAMLVEIDGVPYFQGPVCTMYVFFIHCLCFASVYSLVLITWERYCSITKVLRTRITMKRMGLLYSIVWICACIFSSFAFVEGGFVLQPSYTHCYGRTVPGFVSTSCVAAIFIAVSFLVYAYGRMYLKIRKVFRDGGSRADIRTLRKEKKIAKQFFIIVVCFLTCWLPAGLTWVSAMLGIGNNPNNFYFKKLELYGTVLAFYNSACNPLLYICINKVIRKAVLHRLGFVSNIRYFISSASIGSSINAEPATREIVVVSTNRHDAKNSSIAPANAPLVLIGSCDVTIPSGLFQQSFDVEATQHNSNCV